jgi:hypothetical protein
MHIDAAWLATAAPMPVSAVEFLVYVKLPMLGLENINWLATQMRYNPDDMVRKSIFNISERFLSFYL